MESRTQGSRPRPRTQKNPRPRPRTALPRTSTGIFEAKAKDQGLRRKCSPNKNKFYKNFFQAIYRILKIQKIVLSSIREQGNFRGLEASKPRPRTSKCVLEDSTSDIYIFPERRSALKKQCDATATCGGQTG